jgi:hypothetical protein
MFLFVSFITVALIVLFVGVKTFLDYSHRPKPITMGTDLTEFKETCALDRNVINSGVAIKQSPTTIFEEKCIKDPVEASYLEEIAIQYGDILSGRVLDPNGTRAPSEFLDGNRNPEYLEYLSNQKAAFDKNNMTSGWIDRELLRVGGEVEYAEIKEGFIETLINEYNFPEELISFAVTDERMEKFDESQWKRFAQAMRHAQPEVNIGVLGTYISLMDDFDNLVSYESLEKFCLWWRHDVPLNVCKENIMGNISDETLHEVVRLIDDELYDPEEALVKVLDDNINQLKEDELRKHYHEHARRK